MTFQHYFFFSTDLFAWRYRTEYPPVRLEVARSYFVEMILKMILSIMNQLKALLFTGIEFTGRDNTYEEPIDPGTVFE